MFDCHPSDVLREHFQRKPYQGARPENSRFLFVGLDANYAADIESSAIFTRLLAYHADGPGFWRRTGVHHPFLLPGYHGDGRRYHLTFAKIGFHPRHADLVSFAELLHLPTVGRSALVAKDLDEGHLRTLRNAIFGGDAKFVFLPDGVQRLLASTGMFPELLRVRRTVGSLRILYDGEDRTVFKHLHFSNYGKFEQQLQSEARSIAGLIATSGA